MHAPSQFAEFQDVTHSTKLSIQITLPGWGICVEKMDHKKGIFLLILKNLGGFSRFDGPFG
jgi:hypothetical protein